MAIGPRDIAGKMLRRSLHFAAPFCACEIPVVTYHSIDESGSLLSVSPAMLREQLAVLRAQNWRSLSIGEYADRLEAGTPEPHSLLITFDDGYRNFRETAVPLLKEFGFRATLFMPVDYIGKPPLWLCRDHKHTNSLLQQVRLSSKERAVLGISTNALMHEPLMSWPELVELHKTGFDIQSHSFGHHFLTTLPEEQVIEDLARSREILEDRLGSPVRAIAYPYGAANPQVAAAARKAGFDVGFVSDHGPRDALNMMSWRGGVSGRLTAPELIAILRSWPLYPRLRHFFRQVSGLS